MKFSTKALLSLTSLVLVTSLVYRHQIKKQQEDARIRRIERNRRKRRAAEKDTSAVAVT